jgi:hypothetical protein
MRTNLFLAGIILTCVISGGSARAQSSSNPSNLTVIQRSEGETLAKGYVEAFKLMTSKPVFLTYEQRGLGIKVLAGIRDLRSTGATVVITTERGTTIVIPAANVLSLTDERPPVVFATP